MDVAVMSVDSFTVASDRALVPTVADRIRGILSTYGIEADVALELEICLVEALNNSIEHGYAGDTGQVIEIRTTVETHSLIIEVRDRGKGLERTHLEAIVDLAPDPDDIDAIPERGRGLAIIKKVMNEVSYTQRGGVNTLRMSVRLPGRPSSR
jgi:serine/threonine-protein kinase RsbW